MSIQRSFPIANWIKILGGFLFAYIAIPSTSYAVILDPYSEFGATFDVEAGITAPISSYDTNTDIYSVEAVLGSAADPARLFRLTDFSFPAVSDLIGAFSLTAMVDESGTLLNGNFSWIGGSASLGIGPGTDLLSGTLYGIDAVQGLGGNYFIQSLASVDVVDPILASIVGPVGELLIRDFQDISGWDLNPWGSSYASNFPYTGGPDFWGRPASVPEPATLALLVLGLVGLRFAHKRRGI